MSINNSKIYVVHWKDIDKWIVPRTSLITQLPQGWSSYPLTDLVNPITNKVRVENDKKYKMVGVKWYGEGLFHRESVSGSDLSSKWVMPIAPNAFIYNRLFAWKESFAVVPDEYRGYYVSSEFPQFIVDESTILPKYLYLVFTRRKTINIVEKLSVGSSAVSRNRFKEQDFLNLRIPVPPLSTQMQIVEFWENSCQKALVLKNKADDHERGIEHIVMEELGIRENGPTEQKGPFIVKYREVERWDTFFFRKEFRDLLAQLRNIGTLPLGKCAQFVSRRWEPADFPSGFFNYIQISDVGKNRGIAGYSKAEVKNAPSRATQIVRQGDILISTTRPYLGAFAIVPQEYDGSIASSGFTVIENTVKQLDKDFLLLFLKSYAGLKQFEQRMTGGLYPAIVQTELAEILVPMPPLLKQKDVVEKVRNIQESVRGMKTKMDQIIAAAKITLEAVITGEKSIKDVMDGQE